MELDSIKVFHDKMIIKMNGAIGQLFWFPLGSWFVTLFWVLDAHKDLMKGREPLSRKCKYV